MTEEVLKAKAEVSDALEQLRLMREVMLNQEGSIKPEVSSVPLINQETLLRKKQEKLKQLMELMQDQGQEGIKRGPSQPY